VLCAYLRLPYDPDSTPDSRLGDREVRRTLIRIIRDHLRPEFPGVSRDGHNVERAVFDCRVVSFDDAVFSAGTIRFQKSELKGGAIRFGKVRFTGTHADFSAMRIDGGRLTLHMVADGPGPIEGQALRFHSLRMRDGVVTFTGEVTSRIELDDSCFLGGSVSFAGLSDAAGDAAVTVERVRAAVGVLHGLPGAQIPPPHDSDVVAAGLSAP